ncbi:DUF6495 family protein [Luteibaculum oceani]|uniref:Uncharacterized protein n=1 Tax=Luteibaculum oceani TaxID=1294296 RepID=A0A5C6VFK8_9FLAO|nr:DUF6495 family protein [Luteibaculum oceani]TXC82148.1 hypothetical protein FRX97_03375 [Luteibaculum oceani]
MADQNHLFPILSLKELHGLEKEFIQYLAMSGIEAKEWETIKKEQPKKMGEMLLDFSQGVWKSRLSKINYINHLDENLMYAIHFLKEEAIIIGLRGEVDFKQWMDYNFKQLSTAIKDNLDKLSIFKELKKFQPDNRALEIYKHLKAGARISVEGDLYEILKTLSNGS